MEGLFLRGKYKLLEVNFVDIVENEVSAQTRFLSVVDDSIPPEALPYDRIFRARLTLELYQYHIEDILSDPRIIRREIDILLKELDALFDGDPLAISLPDKTEAIQLAGSHISLVAEDLARKIHARYHYLLTPRAGIFHLGLFSAAGSLLGLASFSENDLSHLNPSLPEGIAQADCLVLSRFITFANAPYNTPTHFLAQTSKWIRAHYSGVKLVISYLDPNLGFGGTIYKAYNASVIAQEAKKRYLYSNGRYASDRSMLERFGTTDFLKLSGMDAAITESKDTLQPLQVFAWDITRKRIAINNKKPRIVSPRTNFGIK